MVVGKRMSSVWVTSIALLLLWLTAQCGQGAGGAQLQEQEGTRSELEEVNELKEKLIIGNRILDLKELVAPYGHLSARIPNSDRIFITSAKSPGLVTVEDVLVVNLDGEVVEGEGITYSEVHLHTGIYKARDDVNAIAHTHSDYAVALTIADIPFQPTMNQASQFIGQAKTWERIGTIITSELGEQVAEFLGADNALLLRQHGAVIVGPTVELTTIRAIFLERAAKLQLLATTVGKPVPLTSEESSRLLPANPSRPWQYYSSKVSKGLAQ